MCSLHHCYIFEDDGFLARLFNNRYLENLNEVTVFYLDRNVVSSSDI